MKNMFWVRQRGKLRSVSYLVLCSLAAIATRSPGSEHTINGKTFQLPDGLTLEVAAPADLVARPICCDFDPQGRLYVAEASGTNDPVGKQLEDKPHRIVRLVDKDQDGNFDQRTIFADNMMFPEGTLWHDGSLYVAAPPVIWKLTDTDDDGIADEREPWFDAKTLTGCANDLHGPYLGRDGWIYWCKGAFAEQTYDRQGKTWTTSAAHIFRRHPATGQVEPVMTGGMDNPVEVVFLPSGERLFTTTFLQHPGGGRRDGIIHAIYGGVYGKDHGVLDGHPRTGDLMPVLVHLGPAAPCGLLQLESPQLGQDYDGDLLCCSFNMHKLTRHKLQRDGATYQSHDEDFLVSKDLDFHPTDVIEDADGSLLVIDTGGWYKLCCPSSQLWKPDVLGCIYRIRATDHAALSDPRGGKLSSVPANAAELAQRLADQRPAVRANTIAAIAHVGQHTNAVHWLGKILRSDQRPNVRLQATWSLARIGTREALSALHPALHDQEVDVRQAAIHAVGLHRDAGALAELHHCLQADEQHLRRAAAEALGRIGNARAVPWLLDAAKLPCDRVLEHSLTYALIELADADATRIALASEHAQVRRIGLLALDQMQPPAIRPLDIADALRSSDNAERDAGFRVAAGHSEWATQLVAIFQDAWQNQRVTDTSVDAWAELLARVAGDESTHPLFTELLTQQVNGSDRDGKRLALQAIERSSLKELPDAIVPGLLDGLDGDDAEQVALILRALAGRTLSEPLSNRAAPLLIKVGRNTRFNASTRLKAFSLVPGGLAEGDGPAYSLIVNSLSPHQPADVRSLAADVLALAKLSEQQRSLLADRLPTIGPLELPRVLTVVVRNVDPMRAREILEQLRRSPSVASLPPETLREAFAPFPADVQQAANALLSDGASQDIAVQREHLRTVFESLPSGDIRRGQAVFMSETVSCYACHAMGYMGGNIGPDLTRIGRIRTELDLLESVLYPSASFVRSYEPVRVETSDGRIVSGIVREDHGGQLTITNTERKHITIARDQIESLENGTVSIMPAGLEKQLTLQQLADLITFLKAAQ